MMKKDFIVRRSIFYVEGKPHVETYSEEELVRCKDCRYWLPMNRNFGNWAWNKLNEMDVKRE